MISLRKPDRCPKCQSLKMKRILWGRPGDEALAMVDMGEACLGGCMMTPFPPSWRCVDCWHEWRDDSDPEQQEMDDSERKLRAHIQERRKAKGWL